MDGLSHDGILDALATIVELEADRFQNLGYDEAAFQKEARAVLGEYNKIASSPMLLLDETMQDVAYDRHTYKHTTIGFLKDIVEMPNQYEYSRKFFDRWYRPDNCIVLVRGGRAAPAEVTELASPPLQWLEARHGHDRDSRQPAQKAERRRDLKWKGVTQPYLYIGYHVPGLTPTSRDIAALDVLGEAIFSQISPLFRKLVLEEARVETFTAGTVPPRSDALHDYGPFARRGRHGGDRERGLPGSRRRGRQADRFFRKIDAESNVMYGTTPSCRL